MDPEEIDFEQAACHRPRVSYGKQLAQKVKLSQGWGRCYSPAACSNFPEDSKACRLVNKTWDELIKERV